jgi:hypothetical protein
VASSQIFLDSATVIQTTFDNQISSPGRTFSVSITNISTVPNSIEMSFLSSLWAAHTKDRLEKVERKAKAKAIAANVVSSYCARNK